MDKQNKLVCRFSTGHFAEEAAEDGLKVVSGYAVRWDDTGDRYGDGSVLIRIRKGAFKDTLANEDHSTAMLEEHGGAAIASTRNGSLTLKEDDEGLSFRATLNTEMNQANDAYVRIRDGITNGISVGISFDYNDVETFEDEDGDVIGRVFNRINNLFEISLVHDPVFSDTEAVARNSARMEDAVQKKQGTSEEAARGAATDVLNARLKLLNIQRRKSYQQT